MNPVFVQIKAANAKTQILVGANKAHLHLNLILVIHHTPAHVLQCPELSTHSNQSFPTCSPQADSMCSTYLTFTHPHTNHKRHASSTKPKPHLPAAQTPVQQRTYTTAHSLNLCPLALSYLSGVGNESKWWKEDERKG